MENIEPVLIEGLETWNIIYDILIDEEEYDKIEINLDPDNLNNVWKDLNNAEYQQRGKVINILNNVNINTNNNLILNKNPYYACYFTPNIILLWKYLFIAKKARSILQKNGASEALNAMDDIAEYLLSKLPLTFNADSGEESTKMRIIYYNEIGQCYKGHLCIGFAEKALSVKPPGKSKYELLGLYNKAIGLAHHENPKSREKALKYYDEVINAFSDPKQTEKYENFNKDLWKFYVYFPSLINKAEVLLKLQRAYESFKLLDSFYFFKDNTASTLYITLRTDYKICQAEILKGHSIIEGSINSQRADNILDKYNPDSFGEKRIIKSKYKFLEAKYYIEKAKNNKDESIDPRTFENTEYLFVEADKYKEKEEQVLAAEYWLEAYKIYLDKGKKFNKFDFLILILDLVINQHWIPIKDKVIALLLSILQKVNNGAINNKDLLEKEIGLCNVLLDETHRPSNYRKVKLNRRKNILERKLERLNTASAYDFPSEEYVKMVRKFVDVINRDYYMQRLHFNTVSFDRRLIYSSYWPQLSNRYAFTVLRKWQSYTPSLGSYTESSRGGGYFVYKVGEAGQIEEGIVIDPGYDFIENFLENNFSIRDISTIAFTHSHPDHSVDFRGLITLVHEMNKRGEKEKNGWEPHRISILATPSCFEHFFHIIEESRDDIKDVIVADSGSLNKDGTIVVETMKHFKIITKPAYHKEINDKTNCIGLIIEVKSGEKLIGFTGDTVWTSNLADNYAECPVVLINMGAILDVRKDQSFKKNFYNDETIYQLMLNENHLYLPGTITLLEQLRKSYVTQLVIVGELGEELKMGLRRDLFYKFNEFYKNKSLNESDGLLNIAIEDIGLTVIWDDSMFPKVICFRCKKYINPRNIKLRITEDQRNSEQLYYYCENCLKIIEARETGEEEHWQMRYLDQPNT